MAGRRSLISSPSDTVLRWFGVRPEAAAPARLAAGRVYLRRPQDSDWRSWAKLRAASREFLTPWEPTWARDALSQSAFRRRLRQYADDWTEGSGYNFLVFRIADDVLLGGINLTNVRRGIVQAGALGYWIGAPHAAQGYMSEAMQGMLRFAFDHLGLHRVEAACLPNNAASVALLHKSGLHEEGRARKYLLINGEWRDHLTFAILREDWAGGARPRAPRR